MSISNAGLIQGWNERVTGESYDWGRWGNPSNVRVLDQGTGQWRQLGQGEAVPAGSRVRVWTSNTGQLTGSPPAGDPGTGQETVTGQDLTLQNHNIAMDLLAAQDRMRQLDQVDMQIQQSHEQFMADLQQQRDIANAQAKNEAARIGVSAAQVQLNAKMAEMDAQARAAELNFRQRREEVVQQREDAKVQLAAATQRAQQEFNAANLNAQQRQAVAELEQNALQMLADRSGPQDWVKYNNLLSGLSGADAATPASEINVDPLARLSDVYQEFSPDDSKFREMEGYTTPGAGGINQPWQAPSAGGAWEGTLGGALGGRSTGIGGQAPNVQAPTSTRPPEGGGGQAPAPGGGGGGQQPAGDPSGGIPNAGLTHGSNLVTVPPGGGIAYERFDPRFEVMVNRNGQWVPLQPGETAPGGADIRVNVPGDVSMPTAQDPPAGAQRPGRVGDPNSQVPAEDINVDMRAQYYDQNGVLRFTATQEPVLVNGNQVVSPDLAGSGDIPTGAPQQNQTSGQVHTASGDATRAPAGSEPLRVWDGSQWVPNPNYTTPNPGAVGGGKQQMWRGDDPNYGQTTGGGIASGQGGQMYAPSGDATRAPAGSEPLYSWDGSQWVPRERQITGAGSEVATGPGSWTPDRGAEMRDLGIAPENTPENAIRYGDDNRMFPAAQGAHLQEGQVGYAGDSKSGKPTGNEEAVIPVGGSAIIVPHEQTERMRKEGGLSQGGTEQGSAPMQQVHSILQQAQQMLQGSPQGQQAAQAISQAQSILRSQAGQSAPNQQSMPGGPPRSAPMGQEMGADQGQRPGPIMQRMAGGGIVSDTVGAGDPYQFTYRMYDQDDLYNQPFLRQIRGEQDTRSFGNFGGGNTVGPWDLPSNMSIQRYSQLQPTAQKMLQGAYDDPETGLAFDDVLESARRASIGTRGGSGMSQYAR